MSKEGFNPLKVSITGIDGAGKSTVAKQVARELGNDFKVAGISRPSFTIVEGHEKQRYRRLLRTVDGLHTIADRAESPRLVLAVML